MTTSGPALDGGRMIWLYHTYTANLLSPVARRLRDEHGIGVTLVCYRRGSLPVPGRHDFDPADFDEIVEMDPYLAPDKAVDDHALGELSDQAAVFENRYGISLMEAIRADRLVGIDFVNGAWFPRSSYGEEMGYARSVAASVRLAGAFEALLDRTRPLAVVGASSALGPSILWRMAKAKGIPVRCLVVARTGKGLFWTDEDHMRPIRLDAAYQKALASLPTAAAPESPAWMPTPYRAQLAIDATASLGTLRHLARQLANAVRKQAVLMLRHRDRVYGRYLFVDHLRLILAQWRMRRRALTERARFAALPETVPYVFFPLQVEPEASLSFESPMCDNALVAIDWLVKTVPAGWLVVVKEHPGATAPRPRGFWDQLERYPNLVIAGTLEPGEEIVRRAQAVAVLNSSLGLQAACIGKPVITFHPAFLARMLSHVIEVNSYETTKEALVSIRNDALPPMAQRLAEGAALTEALEACQFPASDPQLLGGTPTEAPIVPADVDSIVATLIDSLGPTPAAQQAKSATA